MSELIGPFLMFTTILFAHVKFVDLWFSDKGHLKWYWLYSKPTKLAIFSRSCFLFAEFSSILMVWKPILLPAVGVSSIFFMLHYISMVIMSEHRN